ncbi:prepilin-type N-terminal cleavage/methylation domain-containing protein [Candidatus Saccharibacteria bacterium oral taxon 488]|nr:prepilin-type N-terminal cleavage/methylation domain-containing protein [Candidatus Saccharibacteria bacterium oral taxon 488]
MTQRYRRYGFTLIELMLAMAFVSVLLLAIATIAIQAGKLYNRGLTLKSINQSGREISDSLRRDFLQANAGKISGNANSAVVMVQAGGADRSGRLCLGDYSYVWNVPKVVSGEVKAGAGIITEVGGPHSGRPINFARVIDPDGMLCQKNQTTGAYMSTVATDKVTHLLKPAGSNDVVLAIHQMKAARVAGDSGADSLYRLEFVLGTSQLEAVNTANGTCKPPADNSENLDFCAINSFEMIVRTNG